MHGEQEGWDRPGRWFMRRMLRGWRVRVWTSFGLLVGGVVGIVFFLAVWAGRLPWYLSAAIVIAIAAGAPCAVAGIWIAWGLSLRRRVRRWFVGAARDE